MPDQSGTGEICPGLEEKGIIEVSLRNYDSWVGLVYSQPSSTVAGYLKEYSAKYRTAEIDSWFYKIPDPQEVTRYLAQVDKDFTFTCKVTDKIT